jgi:hypothetical protein
VEPARKLSNRDFVAANVFVSLNSSIAKPDKGALKSQVPLKLVPLELVRGD